jgi:hypothetical protein
MRTSSEKAAIRRKKLDMARGADVEQQQNA